ncbi:hypothetical protein BU14_0212s0022 [Porphyra umbilicalis]|uniref:Uncharacterized protein n=1 Tax=Porphyra umbilicalis TaxID=2786 RepID=A0A1X6P546_PORUM|nr:hypothetical protein BU14_0212s0022 [Porphyra umbilicalis]|eukprot:OSX76002.1 hypothetical protein BU14_0212s0022 [Porphyra umbilicalis]
MGTPRPPTSRPRPPPARPPSAPSTTPDWSRVPYDTSRYSAAEASVASMFLTVLRRLATTAPPPPPPPSRAPAGAGRLSGLPPPPARVTSPPPRLSGLAPPAARRGPATAPAARRTAGASAPPPPRLPHGRWRAPAASHRQLPRGPPRAVARQRASSALRPLVARRPPPLPCLRGRAAVRAPRLHRVQLRSRSGAGRSRLGRRVLLVSWPLTDATASWPPLLRRKGPRRRAAAAAPWASWAATSHAVCSRRRRWRAGCGTSAIPAGGRGSSAPSCPMRPTSRSTTSPMRLATGMAMPTRALRRASWKTPTCRRGAVCLACATPCPVSSCPSCRRSRRCRTRRGHGCLPCTPTRPLSTPPPSCRVHHRRPSRTLRVGPRSRRPRGRALTSFILMMRRAAARRRWSRASLRAT